MQYVLKMQEIFLSECIKSCRDIVDRHWHIQTQVI